MNVLIRWIINHKVLLLSLSIIAGIISIIMLIFYVLNATSTQITDTTGESGGAGEPTEQILVLSGWDTVISNDLHLADIISIDTQNHIIETLLGNYTGKNQNDNLILYGTIDNVQVGESGTSFTVTIENKEVYTVGINIHEDTFSISLGNEEEHLDGED